MPPDIACSVCIIGNVVPLRKFRFVMRYIPKGFYPERTVGGGRPVPDRGPPDGRAAPIPAGRRTVLRSLLGPAPARSVRRPPRPGGRAARLGRAVLCRPGGRRPAGVRPGSLCGCAGCVPSAEVPPGGRDTCNAFPAGRAYLRPASPPTPRIRSTRCSRASRAPRCTAA